MHTLLFNAYVFYALQTSHFPKGSALSYPVQKENGEVNHENAQDDKPNLFVMGAYFLNILAVGIDNARYKNDDENKGECEVAGTNIVHEYRYSCKINVIIL
jgi:hypothetical protein